MKSQTKKLLVGVVLLILGLETSGGVSAEQCSGGYANTVKVRGQVVYPLNLNLDDLYDMDVQTITTTAYSGSQGLVTAEYTGVPLLSILDLATVKTAEQVHNDIISKYVIIRATDCYETVLSVADMMPEYGGHQVLVAFKKDGELLDEDGLVKLVIASDKKASRYVSNISSIRVR